MHNCDDTPYITLMQIPLDISHTLTVLSIEDDAMYWLLEEKSKSEMNKEYQKVYDDRRAHNYTKRATKITSSKDQLFITLWYFTIYSLCIRTTIQRRQTFYFLAITFLLS